MKKIFIVFILIVTVFALFALYKSYVDMNSSPSTPQGKIEQLTSDIKPEAIETIAKNLEIPWSISFLPNGDLLFTERKGTLNLISNGNVTSVTQIPNVKHFGEGGLMGLEVHPEFTKNNYIYLMYTYSNNGNDTLNRVVRYKYENNKLNDRQIIVDEIPGARFHNGGRIKYGPDGFLYITTGDSQNPSLAQNTESLAGKILRVTDEGNPAPNNPFNSRIYSYGHRNPQGITWNSDGKLYETEHGRSNPTGYDEVNLIKPGQNYGWPEIEGDETRNKLITPIANSGLGTWAPGSVAYLNGSIFFGGLRGEALYELKLNDDKAILIEHLKNQFGRIRDVIIGPDDMIYITTSNRDGRGEPTPEDDRILKVDPSQL